MYWESNSFDQTNKQTVISLKTCRAKMCFKQNRIDITRIPKGQTSRTTDDRH